MTKVYILFPKNSSVSLLASGLKAGFNFATHYNHSGRLYQRLIPGTYPRNCNLVSLMRELGNRYFNTCQVTLMAPIIWEP